MKFSAVLLLASVVALLSLSAHAYKPAPRCFKKTQKCCFAFRPCGFVIRREKVARRCDFKQCRRVCRRHCYKHCEKKKVRVPKTVCKPKTVRVCRRVEVERYGKWVWVEKCRRVQRRRRCYTTYHYVWRRVCTDKCYPKCYPKCYKVHAICVRYNIFRYIKFCPRLVCDRPTIRGPHKVPAHVVSPKGRFVKVTRPVRTVIRKRRH